MSNDVNDHENMVNKANRNNGRMYSATNNEGVDSMKNQENNKSNENLTMSDIKNLKDLTESMSNLFDKFINKLDETTNEANTPNSSCKCNNKQCSSEKKNEPDQDDAANVREMVERFANHLGESLGCQAAVISMDELEAMCNGCHECDEDDAEDSSDEYDEIIARLKHLEEGIRIVLRGQNDPSPVMELASCRIKPAVSKKYVKKLERKLDDIIEMMHSQQQDIDAITKILIELTAPKDAKNSKSGK